MYIRNNEPHPIFFFFWGGGGGGHRIFFSWATQNRTIHSACLLNSSKTSETQVWTIIFLKMFYQQLTGRSVIFIFIFYNKPYQNSYVIMECTVHMDMREDQKWNVAIQSCCSQNSLW